MGRNDMTIIMDSKKNVKIKISLKKIFEKASYTPYVGDGYGATNEKILFIGNCKLPMDENFIEENKMFPTTNYCTQVVYYSNVDPKEKLISETGRLSRKTIKWLGDAIKASKKEVCDISYYNFYYDQFEDNIEIPNQGLSLGGDDLKKYQTALQKVIEILKPNKVFCESTVLEGQIDGRKSHPDAFEGASFAKWLEKKRIEFCDPSKKGASKNRSQEKNAQNYYKDGIVWIHKQMNDVLCASVKEDSRTRKLFEMLNNKSFEDIDKIDDEKLSDIEKMICILNKVTIEDVDRFSFQDLMKLFLVLDNKSYGDIDRLNSRDLSARARQELASFFEVIREWNFYEIEKQSKIISIFNKYIVKKKKELRGAKLKKGLCRLKKECDNYIEELSDSAIKQQMQPLFEDLFKDIDELSGELVEQRIVSLIKKVFGRNILAMGKSRLLCLKEFVFILAKERTKKNIKASVEDYRKEVIRFADKLRNNSDKEKIFALTKKYDTDDNLKQRRMLEKKIFGNNIDKLDSEEIKKKRKKYEMEKKKMGIAINMDDEEKKYAYSHALEYFLYELNEVDESVLKKMLQILIRRSFECIDKRDCEEIIELSKKIADEFCEDEYLKDEPKLSVYKEFNAFKCLKKIMALDNSIGRMSFTDRIEILLKILETGDMYVANTYIQFLLEYIEIRCRLSIPWLESDLITVADINDRLMGTEPIIFDFLSKQKQKEKNKKRRNDVIEKTYDYRGFHNKLTAAYKDFEEGRDEKRSEYADLMKKRILVVPSSEKSHSLRLYDDHEKDELLKKGCRFWEPTSS